MAAREVPMARPIRHPRRAPQHHKAPAVGDYAVYSDPELRLRHQISLEPARRTLRIRVTARYGPRQRAFVIVARAAVRFAFTFCMRRRICVGSVGEEGTRLASGVA